jgi:hypothetical protein
MFSAISECFVSEISESVEGYVFESRSGARLVRILARLVHSKRLKAVL